MVVVVVTMCFKTQRAPRSRAHTEHDLREAAAIAMAAAAVRRSTQLLETVKYETVTVDTTLGARCVLVSLN
jgi:hypothetical protein